MTERRSRTRLLLAGLFLAALMAACGGKPQPAGRIVTGAVDYPKAAAADISRLAAALALIENQGASVISSADMNDNGKISAFGPLTVKVEALCKEINRLSPEDISRIVSEAAKTAAPPSAEAVAGFAAACEANPRLKAAYNAYVTAHSFGGG